MKEMLGNQAFLARQYDEVIRYFEPFLEKGTITDKMKKKLIIAYCETGRVEKAFRLFTEVIITNPELICETHPILEDCPCPELVYDLEKNGNVAEKSAEYYLLLAMLWAYCNPAKTIDYLETVLQLVPERKEIKQLITVISVYLEKKNQKKTFRYR